MSDEECNFFFFFFGYESDESRRWTSLGEVRTNLYTSRFPDPPSPLVVLMNDRRNDTPTTPTFINGPSKLVGLENSAFFGDTKSCNPLSYPSESPVL